MRYMLAPMLITLITLRQISEYNEMRKVVIYFPINQFTNLEKVSLYHDCEVEASLKLLELQ